MTRRSGGLPVANRSAIETPFRQINNTVFEYTEAEVPESEASDFLRAHGYYAVIDVPEDVMERPEIPIYSFSQVPMELKNALAAQLRERIEGVKRSAVIAETQVPDLEDKLAAVSTPVTVRTLKVSEDTGSVKESSSEIAPLSD